MTRRRWIADRVEGGRAFLQGQNASHLSQVLRAKPGQQFDIAVEGKVRQGTILSTSAQQVEFELGPEVGGAQLPEICVYLSIFKFDRMEWAIEKLTELGVARIVPVIARRTEAHLVKAAAKRVERWRRIVREAAQQSRRVSPPQIDDPVALKKAAGEAQGCRILLSEAEEDVTLTTALAQAKPPVTLALGPEGGWTPEELEMFAQAGWVSASLGQTILRAETAAIAAVAVTVAELQ